MTYRIVNWDDLFENNRTRGMKHMNWVPILCKLDGDGYTDMVSRKNGAAVYGAWIACVIVAGRCAIRGTLLRRPGIPHDSGSLSRITRMPEPIVKEMLDVAQSIGWLEVIDSAGGCEIPAGGCALPNPNPNPNPKHTKGRFTPPTPMEVSEYLATRESSQVDPLEFLAYYESQGWKKANGRAVTDWKACVRTWEAKNKRDNGKPKQPELDIIG